MMQMGPGNFTAAEMAEATRAFDTYQDVRRLALMTYYGAPVTITVATGFGRTTSVQFDATYAFCAALDEWLRKARDHAVSKGVVLPPTPERDTAATLRPLL